MKAKQQPVVAGDMISAINAIASGRWVTSKGPVKK